jgi:hypothetical protein
VDANWVVVAVAGAALVAAAVAAVRQVRRGRALLTSTDVADSPVTV